jgi:peptidoglycan/LPS O-acetylase OafA/YrhL
VTKAILPGTSAYEACSYSPDLIPLSSASVTRPLYLSLATPTSVESEGPQSQPIHLPSLDGLRALSILMVLFGHMAGTRNFEYSLKSTFGDIAHLGVMVFFVISGFLITTLLSSERRKSGSISLRRFYARRVVRIFPAAYTFILCVALLSAIGVVRLNTGDLWHALTYTANYSPHRSWWIGHLWSLSVEEQFYLLWPFAFSALRNRKAFAVALLAVALGPIARSGSWLFLRGTHYYSLEMFPMVADSIAAGCVLAMLRPSLENNNWYMRLLRCRYSVLLLAGIFLINRQMDRTVALVFGTTIVNICLAVLVHRCVYCSRDAVGRILNCRPVAFIGVLSYSLYVWQQLFLDRHTIAWRTAFPQNILLVLAVALLSYFALEKPLLELRHRLKP